MIISTAFLTSFEVLARKLANVSTGGADELSGYALAISSSWAMAFTLLRRAHVRVDALYARLPQGMRGWLDALGILSMTAFAATLTFYCAAVLRDTLALDAHANTTLGTPLWIPQGLWLAGLVLFTAISAMLSVLTLGALMTGNHDLIRRVAASRTTDEDIGDGTVAPQSGRDGGPSC